MLKWFVDLFFEVEEETIEEHHEKQIEKPAIEPIKTLTLNPGEEIKVDIPKESEIMDKEEEKKSIFINDVMTVRHDSISLEKPTEEYNDSYEFTPIISPIFGVDENHQPRKVQRPINKPLIENSSAIGTIISPIYGIEIQRSYFSSTYNLVDEDPKINIDLKEMIDNKPEEQGFVQEENFDTEDELQGYKSSDITEDGVVLKTKENDEISKEDRTKNINVDISEEEKFLEDQQPSLFDYLR